MNPGVAIAVTPARILIVDDEAANREVLTIILLREGYLVATAISGAEAINSVAMQAPDLILLDVMMPEMNGYEAATLLKRNLFTQHIPVIMITALNDQATKLRALGAGANDFLTKPLNRAELCLRVKHFLGAPPATC